MPDIPTELQGKSPEEVAAYYQQQMDGLRVEYENKLADAVHTTPPPSQPPARQPNTTDFWANPVNATNALIKEQFDAMMGPMQDTLILAARMAVKEQFKDFDKFSKEIDTTMRLQPKFNQAQPAMWQTVYYHVRGVKADEIAAAARAEGQRMGAEPVQSQDPPDPNAPKKVVGVEAEVAKGLGIPHDKWNQAKRRVEEGEAWPHKTIA